MRARLVGTLALVLAQAELVPAATGGPDAFGVSWHDDADGCPTFVPVPAALLLGERLSIVGVAGIALVIVGIWMVQAGDGSLGKRLLDPGLRFAYGTLAATVAYSLIDKEAMQVLHSVTWGSPVPRPVLYYYLMCAGHLPLFWLLVP